MALLCCSLVDCFSSGLPELQGLECSLIDRDPWTEARPVMAHDLELSRDSLQLWPGCMFNFYCELFHLSFIFRSISPVLPLSSIGNLAESKTRNPFASLSHDN